MLELSIRAAERRVVSKGPRGKVINFSTCPTQSMLFTRFFKSLLERMGREVRSYMTLDHMIFKIIIRLRWVVILAIYLVICILVSLRVNEGFVVELGGLTQHIYDGAGET